MAFDIRKVTTVVDGVFLTGHSTDSKVKAERMEDTQMEYIGVDGEVDTSINANNAGIIKVPLKSTSPSIRYLNKLANSRAIFPISSVDLNVNGVNATGTGAFVRKPMFPDKNKAISDVEFEIFVGDMTIE